jgi:hypothetical protein
MNARALPRAIIIVLLTVLAAWFAAVSAYVQAVRASGPVGILDPVALSVRGKKAAIDASAKPADVSRSVSLAQSSLRLQALNPAALALIGIGHAAKGDSQGISLIQLSTLTSRRELLAHIANIEDRASNDDAAGALRSYDLALRTSSDASGVLFPILANAVSDPGIRSELVPYIRRQAPWSLAFAGFVVSQPQNIRYFGETVLQAGGLGKMDDKLTFTNMLVGGLIDKGEFQVARQIFVLANQKSKDTLQSVALNEVNFKSRYGRFAWVLNESPEYGGTRTGDGKLDLYARANMRGEAARKTLFLDTGMYRLSVGATAQFGQKQPVIQFLVLCAKGTVLSQLFASAEQSPISKGRDVEWQFEIPAGCDAQILQIFAVGADQQEGSEASISSIELKPV